MNPHETSTAAVILTNAGVPLIQTTTRPDGSLMVTAHLNAGEDGITFATLEELNDYCQERGIRCVATIDSAPLISINELYLAYEEDKSITGLVMRGQCYGVVKILECTRWVSHNAAICHVQHLISDHIEYRKVYVDDEVSSIFGNETVMGVEPIAIGDAFEIVSDEDKHNSPAFQYIRIGRSHAMAVNGGDDDLIPLSEFNGETLHRFGRIAITYDNGQRVRTY